MTLEKFRFDDKRPIRKALESAFEKADLILETEKELVKVLQNIDARRLFVYVGYKSLMGFCDHSLGFSRTQSLRIVTMVRRSNSDARSDPSSGAGSNPSSGAGSDLSSGAGSNPSSGAGSDLSSGIPDARCADSKDRAEESKGYRRDLDRTIWL